MASRSGNLLSSAAMFIPLLAVPFLAAFGLPEFTPLAASPSANQPAAAPATDLGPPLDPGVGESRRYTADDLFKDFNEPAAEPPTTGPSPAAASPPTAPSGEPWADPFEKLQQEQPQAPNSAPPTAVANAPAEALRDWTMETSPAPSGPPPSPAASSPAPMGMPPVAADAFEPPPAASPPAPAATETSHSVPLTATDPLGSATAAAWQTAIQQLNALGVRDFRMAQGQQPGQFHFSCVFSETADSQVTQRFEAEAKDPLLAVQQVLAQIDTWKQMRQAAR